MNIMDYTEKIQPFDVIVVYNPLSLLHRLIKGVTHEKAGHVALYVGDDTIAEASSKGIDYKKIKTYKPKAIVKLARAKRLTEEKKGIIKSYCGLVIGQKYAFIQLVAIWIKYLLKL